MAQHLQIFALYKDTRDWWGDTLWLLLGIEDDQRTLTGVLLVLCNSILAPRLMSAGV